MAVPTPDRARVFGTYAEAYHDARPGYPAELVSWLLPDGARVALDVGAGTGKLTAALVGMGLEVTAVEPDPGMLAVLRAGLPGVPVVEAGADALPAHDASVDAVLVGQAWHWFPHEVAVAEVRRVLRPGGRLGLLWNATRWPDGWAREIARLDPDVGARAASVGAPPSDGSPSGELPSRDPRAPWPPGLPADGPETRSVEWDWHVTPDQLVACLATFSVFATMPPDERAERLGRARAIAAAEADRIGSPTVAWPWQTVAYRWAPDARAPVG